MRFEYQVMRFEYQVVRFEYQVVRFEYQVVRFEYQVVRFEYQVVSNEFVKRLPLCSLLNHCGRPKSAVRVLNPCRVTIAFFSGRP